MKQKVSKSTTRHTSNKWGFRADNALFPTIKQAKQYAEDFEALEVTLIDKHSEREEILYQFNPMSERLERVRTINQAKAALKN